MAKASWFDLDSDLPAVTVAAAYSKRRRDDRQPLPPDLVPALRSWIAEKAPGRPLWGHLTKHTADMIRHDLAAAGIAYRDDNGRVADFHSLRGTYISLIVSGGASVKTAQTLARHSTPSLTIGIYAKASVHDLAGAVESLPDVTGDRPRPEALALASTGTDGRISNPLSLPQPYGTRGRGHFTADDGGTEIPGLSIGSAESGKTEILGMTAVGGSGRSATDTGIAEGVGFEPTDRRNLLTVFKTVAIKPQNRT